jgi:hypothetical protein
VQVSEQVLQCALARDIAMPLASLHLFQLLMYYQDCQATLHLHANRTRGQQYHSTMATESRRSTTAIDATQNLARTTRARKAEILFFRSGSHFDTDTLGERSLEASITIGETGQSCSVTCTRIRATPTRDLQLYSRPSGSHIHERSCY